ncbi:MAG: AzlD domain-containing protein [Clostridia bacterium]|nr:AzlD domain-containing protein [Oscillospiraceae bacterium]MBQ1956071.1 AzlD domain-containing protein [Clostridia bacterium]
MDNRQFWLYLLVMAGSTYLIRAIPFSLVRKKIKNRFIRSFLFYIPFAVLSAMTLPSALYATDTVIGAAVGIAVAVVLSLWNKSLTVVAASACGAVLLTELLLRFI